MIEKNFKNGDRIRFIPEKMSKALELFYKGKIGTIQFMTSAGIVGVKWDDGQYSGVEHTFIEHYIKNEIIFYPDD